MLNPAFEASLPFIMRWEGGYVDHPDDPGGRTNKGVTQKTYDGWRTRQGLPTRHVRMIEDDEVETIYETGYWVPPRCDLLQRQLDLVQFDTAVNMGVGRAGRFLQESLNMLNRDGDLYPEIGEDGLIGSVTLGTLEQLLATRDGDRHLHDLLNILQGMQYVSILRNNASQRKFIRGWLRRVSV